MIDARVLTWKVAASSTRGSLAHPTARANSPCLLSPAKPWRIELLQSRTEPAQSRVLQSRGQREKLGYVRHVGQFRGSGENSWRSWASQPFPSRQRMLRRGALAEGDEPGSNLLQAGRTGRACPRSVAWYSHSKRCISLL